MLESAIVVLLWSSLIGSAVFAGINFAFSGFVMPGLARVAPAEGMAAMNAINLAFVKSLMLPLFILTALTHLGLVIAVLLYPHEPGATAMIAGGVVYVVGMFLCTVIFEVPLNNALLASSSASSEGLSRWAHYLKVWTRWNHVRTVAALISFILLAVAVGAQ